MPPGINIRTSKTMSDCIMRRALAALALVVPILLATPAAASELPRPAELEPAVAFWTQVYSQVDSESGLLHDRRDLNVVYEVVDLQPGRTRDERRAGVRERREHYESILQQLASGKREDLSDEARRVLALFPDDVDNATLRQAADEVRFQLGQADRFRRGMIRAGAWEPHIRSTLADMGLPPEIAALPHVESSFNPNAYSRIGAAGMWQFTRATGQRFMRVDNIVDERMDPFASSVAAARLLQHNYSVTGDWALAITAYNHGLAGIRRAARATGSDDIADIVREYEGRNWGFASRNFYAAFLAAVDVEYAGQHYFGLLDRHSPVVSETIDMPFYARIDDIKAAFEVDRDELRALNRALRPAVWNGEKLVPRGYTLRVPAGPDVPPAADRLARIDSDQRYFAQVPDRYHRVARGESLSIIASRYGVSTRELVQLNNLRSANLIQVGQQLRLPGAGDAPIGGRTYTVQSGDNLSRIAQRVGMRVSALAAANNIDPSRPIQPGQELRIDGRPVEGAEPAVATAEEDDPASADDAPPPSETAAADLPAAEPDTETPAEADPGDVEPGEIDPGDTEPSTLAQDEPGALSETAAFGDTVDFATTFEILAAMMPAEAATTEERLTLGTDGLRGPPAALAAAPALAERANDRGADDEQEPMLAADPSDYTVADDGTIEVQAAETLGHYAEWLDLRASHLRRINNKRFGSPVVIGHRLKLDFRHVEPEYFERQRRDYHQALQVRFFDQFRITGAETLEIQSGDSLWTLARRHDNIPVWLMRQYNPDLDFDRLRPGMTFELPMVQRHEDPEPTADREGDDDRQVADGS